MGDSFSLPTSPLSDSDVVTDSDLELYEDDSNGTAPNIPAADLVDATGKPVQLKSFEDTLINLEVLLPQDDGNALAKVLRRSVDAKGHFIGSTYSDNPLWNTAVYDCKFADGTTKSYAANVIAESIYDGVNADGYAKGSSYMIIDHKSSGEAVKKEDKWFITKSGTKRLQQTTVGWKLLIEWADGTRQWTDLRLLKNSSPVQVAEYATARGIVDEPGCLCLVGAIYSAKA